MKLFNYPKNNSSKKDNVYIYKYFYYFLCYTLIFKSESSLQDTHSKKTQMYNGMMKSLIDGRLKDIDVDFWNMVKDMEIDMALNRDETSTFQYMNFIERYLD